MGIQPNLNHFRSLRDCRTFQELAETWRRETQDVSFMQQRAMHPAYHRIIGMGWVAVPLILGELAS